jgi:hypothetical protein
MLHYNNEQWCFIFNFMTYDIHILINSDGVNGCANQFTSCTMRNDRLGYTDIIDLNFFLVLLRDRMHGVLDFVSGAR